MLRSRHSFDNIKFLKIFFFFFCRNINIMTKSIDLWKNLSPSPKTTFAGSQQYRDFSIKSLLPWLFLGFPKSRPFTELQLKTLLSDSPQIFRTISIHNVHCTVSVVVWVRIVVSFKYLRRHFDWFPSELCFYCGGVNGPRLPIQFVTPVHLTERSASGINKPWTWPKHSDIACLQTLTWQFFWYSNLPTKEQKESLQ